MATNQESKKWHSSYEKNNYGDFFYSLVRIYRPDKIVELGTLTGYSAYHMARALRENKKGTLDCYDTWEDNLNNYGLHFTTKQFAEENLDEFKDIISLEKKDAIGIEKKYSLVDILHVDLDNEGAILEKVIPAWIDKVTRCIILEGGSTERDRLATETNYKKIPLTEWLDNLDVNALNSIKEISKQNNGHEQFVVVKGKEEPISKWLKDFSEKRKDINYITIEPFPSLTLIIKT